VVLGEGTGQGAGQERDFALQSAQREVRQDPGIALAVHECVEHGPGGAAGDVGDDGAELDPGVFQEHVEPVDVAGPVTGGLGAVAGQVPQLADVARGDGTGPDQAVLDQAADPLAVLHVGLAARHGLDVLGVQ
jgi:hypothetical protein